MITDNNLIKFPNKNAANGYQNGIHSWAKANIADYKADLWSPAWESPDQSEYAIVVQPRVKGGISGNPTIISDEDEIRNIFENWTKLS